MRRQLIAAAWFLGTALVAYAALISVFLILVMSEGSGIGGNGFQGPVASFLDRIAPWGMIAGITASVVAGLIVARHKARRWTGSGPMAQRG